MNELIKKIAENSGISIPKDTEYNGSVHRKALEFFAQRIALECIYIMDDSDRDIDYAIERICKDFGIE